MATVTFTGTNGVLSTGTNWSTGSLPAGGDDAVVDSGTADLAGDLTAINLGSFTVTSGWKGSSFGTAGTPVTLQATRVDLNFSPNCRVAHVGPGASTIATLRCVSTGGAQLVVSGAGTVTQLQGGPTGSIYVDVTACPTIKTCRSQVIATASATAFTTAVVGRQGSLETKRGITTARVSGVLRTRSTAAVATAYVAAGGLYNHQSSGGAGSTSLEVEDGGEFSAKGATQNFTITSLAKWFGATVQEQGDGIVITISARVPVGQTG